MTDTAALLVMGLAFLATLVYHAWYVREHGKERSQLLNAIMSKTPQEFQNLEVTRKLEPVKVAQPPSEPDFVPEDQLPDEQWEKLMREGKLAAE